MQTPTVPLPPQFEPPEPTPPSRTKSLRLGWLIVIPVALLIMVIAIDFTLQKTNTGPYSDGSNKCLLERDTVITALAVYKSLHGTVPPSARDESAAATVAALNDSLGPDSKDSILWKGPDVSSPSIEAGYRYLNGVYSGGSCP